MLTKRAPAQSAPMAMVVRVAAKGDMRALYAASLLHVGTFPGTAFSTALPPTARA